MTTFLIPMRGNEMKMAGVGVTQIYGFLIPMRGNEQSNPDFLTVFGDGS